MTKLNQKSLINFTPQEALDADVIFVSHSGGKDSQAALALLIRMGLKDKIVLVHSDLGEMEWESMDNWISTISFGLPLNVVQADEDFFELCRRTGRLPSGLQQYCTDVLKTKPIGAFLHKYMYENNLKTALNVTGMRAEESIRRADKMPLTLSKGKGTSEMHMVRKHAGHTIHDWMPIFYYTTEEVFEEIALANQKPHKIYADGKFSRLSCVFCINGRINEHKEAALLRPELAKKMIELERELGRTLRVRTVKGKRVHRYLDEYVNEPTQKPRKVSQKKLPDSVIRFPNYLGSYLIERELIGEAFAV